MLMVGRTGPSPFRVLDQQDLQAKRSTASLQYCGCLSSTLPWNVIGWEIPGLGGVAGALRTGQPLVSLQRGQVHACHHPSSSQGRV